MADRFGNVVNSRVPIFDNEDEVEKVAKQFKSGKPEAFLVWNGTDEHWDENNISRVNSVIDCVLLVYFRVKASFGRENSRVESAIGLKNEVLNALYTDRTRGGLAHYLIVDGEAIYGTLIDTAETDAANAPVYKIRIPIRCTFQHTETGR